jgi:DNA-binding SARP family transcriptional activator
MRISLFGNLRISFAGRPVTAVNTNRLQSLIAYLILHGDTPQPREQLAFMLWPASSESQARTNLRQLLHHLKRALPAECNLLVTDHFTVGWRQDALCTIDTVVFQVAIAEAATARKEKDRARETQSLTTAAQLYEDDPCLRSTTTGSRHCAKTTGGGSPRCCTVWPQSSRSRRNTPRPSRTPRGLSHWIR